MGVYSAKHLTHRQVGDLRESEGKLFWKVAVLCSL